MAHLGAQGVEGRAVSQLVIARPGQIHRQVFGDFPSVMTATRSARYTASVMSCVTKNTVVCARRQILRRSSCNSSRVIASRAAKGSSSSKSDGASSSARAMATRLCWPPESSVGKRRPKPDRPMSASNSWARVMSAGTGLRCSETGSNTLSITVFHSSRVGDWKTKPSWLPGLNSPCPSTLICPPSGRNRPAASLSSVVLPQPLRPTRLCTSPRAICQSTWSTTFG